LVTAGVLVRPGVVGICEDDDALRSVLRRALVAEGYEVCGASDGRQAVDRFALDGVVDALILDIGLPDADGRDVCQALRARGVGAPVLFLTARETLTDRLSGFHAGGDDYVTKPFELAEVLVRVHALLRRARPTTAPVHGDLRLDPGRCGVGVRGHFEALTPTEFRLLAALAARSGDVVRRRELVAAAWPAGAIVHDNTLDTYLKRLRRKLRDLEAEAQITTLRGIGYALR